MLLVVVFLGLVPLVLQLALWVWSVAYLLQELPRDLATLGSVIGGGMVAGLTVAATIPLAAGATGYAIIRAVKYFADEWQLNVTELNEHWEIPINNDTE